jgi:CheY-like chemotaxis protein
VARVNQGKIRLDREPTDLGAVVMRAVEASLPIINSRQHHLKLSLPRQPLLLSADPARLEQVFVNLLTNAAKYTTPGGNIEVSAALEGDTAIVRVRDSGVGIAPSLLPCIFDLFVQAEQGAERSQGGLGIGLTLVKSLVELHGGTVEARSDGPGCGSEFIVRLPSARDETATERQAAAAHVQAVRPRRILVVDDSQDQADSLALLLRLRGHEVSIVNDGTKAVATAADFRPEVVLLDIGLPGMDGYEIARRIRRQGEGSSPLLIAITGYGQQEDRRRSAEAGFDHHLVKPPDPEALQRLIAGPR